MESPEMKRRRIVVEEEGTRMECLPREIIADILSRLPVTCLMKLQFVCKTWRSLALDSDLVMIDQASDPCLVFHCDYPIRNQLCFVDLSGHNGESSSSISSSYIERPIVRKFKMPFWDRMPEFDVVGSCNGLLCLADSLYRDALFVYNPFTREFRELPKGVQYPEQEVVFGFGFHPETKQYKVVKIVYYRNGHSARARRLTYPYSIVQVLTIGNSSSSSSWKTISKVPYQLVRRPSEALVYGRLHWVTRPRRYHPTRRIISFDLGSDQFQEVFKPDDCDVLNRCNFHLVNLRGCLSAVVNCNHGKMEIWAMKEYGVKESWAKEASIGAYLFKGLKQNVDQSVKIWKNGAANGRAIRVLCVLRNGDILLEYKGRVLVSYDPKSRKFKDFMFKGMPNWFQTVVHSGTLNWVDTKFDD